MVFQLKEVGVPICSHCGLEKPESEFYRRSGKEKGAKRFRSHCKACLQDKNNQKDRTCKSCGIAKSLSEFKYHAGTCRECVKINVRESSKRWAENNPDKKAQHKIRYRTEKPGREYELYKQRILSDPEFAQREKERSRKWKLANAEKVKDSLERSRLKNRNNILKQREEKRRAEGMKPKYIRPRWELDGVVYLHCSHCDEMKPTTDFYLQKTGLTAGNYRHHCIKCTNAISTFRNSQRYAIYSDGSLTLDEWINKVEEYGNRCAYCFIKLERAHMDHIIPISRGGPHTKDNVVPCCRSCNSGKQHRTPHEWLNEIKVPRSTLIFGSVSKLRKSKE